MTTKKKEAEASGSQVTIPAPKLETVIYHIRGNAPYVQNKFSAKAKEQMRIAQESGSKRKSSNKKEAKDFQKCYENSMHIAADGWRGIPAPAFRSAMISACRVAGIKMTHAKLALKAEADGFDAIEGTPLIRITKGDPHYHEAVVRLQGTTTDIRARAMWDAGWEAAVRITYDADYFDLDAVTHLMMRAGMQVGVGEGRPDSKSSAGMGWGTFELLDK